jgi:hypothetical protein
MTTLGPPTNIGPRTSSRVPFGGPNPLRNPVANRTPTPYPDSQEPDTEHNPVANRTPTPYPPTIPPRTSSLPTTVEGGDVYEEAKGDEDNELGGEVDVR